MSESYRTNARPCAARAVLAVLVIAALSACSAARDESVADETAAAPTSAALSGAAPFPPGFDWPANPAVLERAIAQGDWAALRRHGWYLWAGINTNTPNGLPVWWSWPTSSQAFPYQSPPPTATTPATPKAHGLRAKNAVNTPVQLPAPVYPPPIVSGDTCATGSSTQPGLPDGERFQSNGDIMIAGVVYNADAFGWIQQASLAEAPQLTVEWNRGQGDKVIKPFPSRSIVLKHMYWPLKGDDLTALPVWDPQSYPPQPPTYTGYERWKRIVVVDPSGRPVKPGMTAVARYLFHIFESDGTTPLGPLLKTGPVVSVNDFYHERIDADALAALSDGDRAILDASACWLFNRPFRAGDILATVALHINTKEVPTWALQSLWWHDRPNVGPYAANRPDISPSKAPGPWRHYLMTIEYGIEASPGMLPVAFNPYIELAAGHPIETNCRNCHSRAAWPRKGAVPNPPATASYQADGGPGLLVDIPDDDPVFDQLMRLDFQWAVSDRAGDPP